MDIPDLVQQELGDEEIRAGVNLGDEDAVCFTPTRTLVYRGEGLLSDESVDTYPYDFERLTVSEGRRKTKFTLVYVDDKRDLGVPNDRATPVLERLLEGQLRTVETIPADESVTGVFRFSELTLVVTERRLLKHVGNVTWDADFEGYPFDDVTGLDFEEGSVATAIVLHVGDRPERIKAPAEQARSVQQTLEQSLFAFHDVSSLEELNAAISPETDEEESEQRLGLESGIDPLVDDGTGADGESDDATDRDGAPDTVVTDDAGQRTAGTTDGMTTGRSGVETAGDDELAELRSQVEELTETVQEQNEQLRKQEQTIKQLIKELRQGR